MQLCEILDAERIRQGLSQAELARRSGHPVSTIHGILTGENHHPWYYTIADLCAVLKLSLDELERRRT